MLKQKTRWKNHLLVTVLILGLLVSGKVYLGKAAQETPGKYALAISNEVTMGKIYDHDMKLIGKGVDNETEIFEKEYAESFSNLIGPDIWTSLKSSYTVRGMAADYLYGLKQDRLKELNPFTRNVGNDIQLSLEGDLTNFIYSLLTKNAYTDSAVLVLNYKTGEILAAVSLPTFDLNDEGNLNLKDGLLSDDRADNKVFKSSLMLGSTMKPLLYAALLEIDPSLEHLNYQCVKGNHMFQGVQVQCDSNVYHGSLSTMKEGLRISCNGYALAAASAVPQKQLLEKLKRFGFDNSFSFSQSLTYSDSTYYGAKADAGDKVRAAIGAGNCRGSLLSLGISYSAIFNKGVAPAPKILLAACERGESEFIPTKDDRSMRMCSEETAEKVVEMMAGVTENGTGKRLDMSDQGYRIASKTGTAEETDRVTNTLWCVAGVTEVESRESYLVITCIDHAKPEWTSSQEVCGAAREILEYLLLKEGGKVK